MYEIHRNFMKQWNYTFNGKKDIHPKNTARTTCKGKVKGKTVPVLN
jgi:hypothetical protein